MRRRVIAPLWAGFEKQCVPPTAGAVQRHEMRLAFYAGAHALFGSILAQLSPGDAVEAADLALLDDVSAEFDDHLMAVTKAAR